MGPYSCLVDGIGGNRMIVVGSMVVDLMVIGIPPVSLFGCCWLEEYSSVGCGYVIICGCRFSSRRLRDSAQW